MRSTLIAIILLAFVGCNPRTNPDPPTPPVDPPTDNEELLRLHELHNQERGGNYLEMNDKLMVAAQKHAMWMAEKGRMSHTGAGGSSFWDRITAEGYRGMGGGENVAYGYSSPESVMNGWMNSRGHRNNILNDRWEEVGYGVAYSGSNLYWCTVFAVPAPQGVEVIIDEDDLMLPPPLDGTLESN